jgi:hypothetical protein
LKNKLKQKSGGVAQVVGHLPSKHKTLSSNSSTTGKQNKTTQWFWWSSVFSGLDETSRAGNNTCDGHLELLFL